MRKGRAALFAALLLPLTGCVFAVGTDDEETERLRDRVRDLEKRVDRIERPFVSIEPGRNATVYKVVEGTVIKEESTEVEPPKEPK